MAARELKSVPSGTVGGEAASAVGEEIETPVWKSAQWYRAVHICTVPVCLSPRSPRAAEVLTDHE